MTLDVLTIIVFLNVVATIALWRIAVRRPAKLKTKFLDQLLHSEPITPRHERPPPLNKDAWGVGDEVCLFFDDFEDFADVVNDWLVRDGTSWRLQELSDARLRLDSYDSPSYGRRFAIFHNQVRLGTLEVSDFFYESSPGVLARLHLDYVRLLPFWTVQDLLASIAIHTADPDTHTNEYVVAQRATDRAMMAVLWTTNQASTSEEDADYGELDVRFEGSASFYFKRRQVLLKQSRTGENARGRS